MTDPLLFESPPLAPFVWTPSRRAAEARLKAFLPHAGKAYAARRNYDRGPDNRDNISLLSPFIRHRLLLEEEVLRATLARHSPSSAEKFIQEVLWRGYFKGWLEQRPDIWIRYQAELDVLLAGLEANGAARQSYDRAVEGRTGMACFDAWARELVETGYLHNHARMWFASIWIFTLRLPWHLGADFFYRHLLDGDPAANTLSWRWVGGLHTRGKTYLARAANIDTYTESRFPYPSGLANDAPPLEDTSADSRRPLRPAECAPASDIPVLLLATEDDCHLESLALGQARPVALAGLTATQHRSPLPVGAPVRAFARGAVADAVTRASTHFGLPDTPVVEASDWAPPLIDRARAAKIDTIVTGFAPVGPVADKLAAARPRLAAAGITVLEPRRRLDALIWPHATAGFFKVKAKIPQVLEELGLAGPKKP